MNRLVVEQGIRKLEQMTENLPAAPDLKDAPWTNLFPGQAIYECFTGHVYGKSLYHQNDVAVQICWAEPAQVEFPEHVHEETEHLVVVTGNIRIIMGGKNVTLIRGESYRIPPGVPHRVIIDRETCLIGVTIPASEGYPSGG